MGRAERSALAGPGTADGPDQPARFRTRRNADPRHAGLVRARRLRPDTGHPGAGRPSRFRCGHARPVHLPADRWSDLRDRTGDAAGQLRPRPAGVGLRPTGPHRVRRRTRNLRPAGHPRLDDERERASPSGGATSGSARCWSAGGCSWPPWRSSVMAWSPTTSIAGPPTPPRGDSGSVRTTRPRTLPEALRELTPEALTQLIEHRPDLGSPPPIDLAELAGRSTTSSSISRALDGLNAWQRVVVEALAALPDPTTSVDLTGLLAGDPDAVTRALGELRERALLWGDDDQLHLVRPVREAQLPYPGGLAPASPRPLSKTRIDAELAACGADDLAVLERLHVVTDRGGSERRPPGQPRHRPDTDRAVAQPAAPAAAGRRQGDLAARGVVATPLRPVHSEADPARAARADQHRPRRARPPPS